MFRKLIFAVALALGIGGGAVTMGGAQAAVVHPATSNALIQAIEQSGPAAATEVQWRRRGYYHHRGFYPRRGFYHRRGWGYRRGYYHRRGWGYHRCRWVNRRVHYGYRWAWVRRRVCW